MSIQVLGGQKRSRAIVGIVALTLTLAIFLLATQATSVWSSRGGAQRQPALVRTAPSSGMYAMRRTHLLAGCWVKFGCDRDGTTMSTGHGSGGRIPDGCRVKFGCPKKKH
jgi:hypothetical protein